MHAAGESIQGPLPPNTNAVVLAVDNEHQLREIAAKLSIQGVPHILIRETDEPYAGQCTAIGVVPLEDRSKIKKIVSSLNLLGVQSKRLLVQSQP